MKWGVRKQRNTGSGLSKRQYKKQIKADAKELRRRRDAMENVNTMKDWSDRMGMEYDYVSNMKKAQKNYQGYVNKLTKQHGQDYVNKVMRKNAKRKLAGLATAATVAVGADYARKKLKT